METPEIPARINTDFIEKMNGSQHDLEIDARQAKFMTIDNRKRARDEGSLESPPKV